MNGDYNSLTKIRICSQMITDGEHEPIRRSAPFMAVGNIKDFIARLNRNYPLFHHWIEEVALIDWNRELKILLNE